MVDCPLENIRSFWLLVFLAQSRRNAEATENWPGFPRVPVTLSIKSRNLFTREQYQRCAARSEVLLPRFAEEAQPGPHCDFFARAGNWRHHGCFQRHLRPLGKPVSIPGRRPPDSPAGCP